MKKKAKSKVKNKDLEKDITSKFMEVVHGLGHDAAQLKKEIAKAGKAVTKKITNALEAAKLKTGQIADKTEKKAGKKIKAVKEDVQKAVPKAEKAVKKANKDIASKVRNRVASLSVAKPALPAIHHPEILSEKKEVVKEASAVPVKRTRAPRRSKEEIESAKSTEKIPVKEASAAPVKRKRAPRKPQPVVAADQETVNAEDREVAASTITD